ncbi:MAG: Rho-binding antiterminator [Reinekea sp.]|nr:Rho-binding antiterminator [Reinekea sp.]
MNKPIACDIQDHFEHVCVLTLPVRLTRVGGERIQGIAATLRKVEGDECLVLRVNGGEQAVPLQQVATLRYPHSHGDEEIDGQRWRVIRLR